MRPEEKGNKGNGRPRGKCVVIYSHSAGAGNFSEKLSLVRGSLEGLYGDLEFFCALSKEEAARKARDSEGAESIIAVGGDGTFNNIVNAVAPLSKRPTLGYLNFGTIGDIGRNFGVTRDLKKSLGIIEKGHVEPFDVGEINGRYFAYVCTIGRYSAISYKTPRARKKKLGRLAYYFAAVPEMANRKQVRAVVEANGERLEVKAPFLLLLNGRNIGGFRVNRKADTSDGKMELFIPRQSLSNGVAGTLVGANKKVIISDAFRIRTDEDSPWCLDGEAGPVGDAEIRCHKRLLSVYSEGKRP
jgi:diacylglycerol kinase (ATP)